MKGDGTDHRIVRASSDIAADAATLFELVADPAQQPRWDGNDNLLSASPGQRVRAVGDVFVVVLTGGSVRENHVVEFESSRRIAWRPAEPGQRPPGHLWRWEFEAVSEMCTHVTLTYDWTELTDRDRFARARWTTAARLQASISRLASLVETGRAGPRHGVHRD